MRPFFFYFFQLGRFTVTEREMTQEISTCILAGSPWSFGGWPSGPTSNHGQEVNPETSTLTCSVPIKVVRKVQPVPSFVSKYFSHIFHGSLNPVVEVSDLCLILTALTEIKTREIQPRALHTYDYIVFARYYYCNLWLCKGRGHMTPAFYVYNFMFIWYLQIFGSLCEGMTNLQAGMFLHGVSIQLLKGKLAAFLQRKVLWKCNCNSTASLLLLNIAGWEWAHHKVIRARRWNVFYRKPSWQNVSVSTSQGTRPPRNLPSPLPVSLTRRWSPAAPLSPDKSGVQFCADMQMLEKCI